MRQTTRFFPIRAVLSAGLCAVLMACEPVRVPYMMTRGSHAPPDDVSNKQGTFVVWSNHPGVAHTIMGLLQQKGHKVVERARLEQIFREQQIRLTHTPDDEADILRVGKLLGATGVVFAEVTIKSESYSVAGMVPFGGLPIARSESGTVYHVSAAVRGVRVESGEVRWSGTAHYLRPGSNPDQEAVSLAEAAIARAMCPIEQGYQWHEPSGSSQDWCVKKE